MKKIVLFFTFFMFCNYALANTFYCPKSVSVTSNGHILIFRFTPADNNHWANNQPVAPKNILTSHLSSAFLDGHFAACIFHDNHGTSNQYTFRYKNPPLYPDITNPIYGNNWKVFDSNGKYVCKIEADPSVCPFTTINPSNSSNFIKNISGI